MPLLFNPARASLEELEATLVARWPLLERLESDLLADTRKKTRRHWQLIGPRGSGKSHFSEVLARRLVRDHGWAVARLPEEHYQIGSVGELLEQIVIRLEQSNKSPFVGVKQLSDLEDLAIDRIRQWQLVNKKPILVILENLGILFERQLRDRRSQSRLREILTRDSPFILLGTATSYVDATVQHTAPFYDFFQVLTLEDLSSNAVAELVEARARWNMDEMLLSRLETVRARIHAVFHFSGGNPRLVLALYSILKQGFTNNLHTQLLKLLDEVTPYYQQRLADISPQMGRILAEMALASDALTPADIARQCRMPINHATANVAKLVAERFVRPIGRPDKRRRFYEVNDRLFRLWMQMREDHTARQRLRFLSEFFQHWYEGHPDEIRHAAVRVAEAFWQDLQDESAQRCREHLTTLEYLQDALPQHAELLAIESLMSRRPNTSTEETEAQVRRLRPLVGSKNTAVRDISALLLAKALQDLGEAEEAIEVLRAADTPELPREYRYVLWGARLRLAIAVSGPKKALAEGVEVMRQDPFLERLKAVLSCIAIQADDVAHGRHLLDEYILSTGCAHCADQAVRRFVKQLLVSRKFDDLAKSLGLYENLPGVSRTEVQALRILSAPLSRTAVADRFMTAIKLWTQLSDVPKWLLRETICVVSNSQGNALKSFPLIKHWAERGENIDQHTIYHLLLGLLESSDDTSPSFATILDWITTHVLQSELTTVFVEGMPSAARTLPGGGRTILHAYKALRDRGALPPDLVPYSAVLEVSEAPDRITAYSPELREAVELLVGAPHHARDKGGSSPQTHLPRGAITSSRPSPQGSRRGSRSLKPSTA